MMDRKEKIKILEAIKGGKIKPADLKDTYTTPSGCMVVHNGQKNTAYYMNGKEINEAEFEKYQADMESRNKVLRIIGEPEIDHMIVQWEEILSYE